MTEPRWKLIAHLRAQIAAGTYYTDARMRVVADKLIRSLTGRPASDTVGDCDSEQGACMTDIGVGAGASKGYPPKSPEQASLCEPNEFHKAMCNIVFKMLDQANGVDHLVALAKAQVVSGEAIRRLIVLGQDQNPTKQNVMDAVMTCDRQDEGE